MNFISSPNATSQLNQNNNLSLVSAIPNNNIIIPNYLKGTAPSMAIHNISSIPNLTALSALLTNASGEVTGFHAPHNNMNHNIHCMNLTNHNTMIPLHLNPTSVVPTTPFIVTSIPNLPSNFTTVNPFQQIHNHHSIIHVLNNHDASHPAAMLPPSVLSPTLSTTQKVPFPSIKPIIPPLSANNAFTCTSDAPDTKPLINHIKKLESEKETSSTWVCKICAKSFLHECNLKIHSIIHTDKALHCAFCNKPFARASNLDQHLRVHTNYRPWNCSHCNKSFRQKHSLKDHLRTHTGERPFKCHYCPRAFKVKHNLVTHTRLHTGERPFECSVCPKRFASKSSLNGHIRQKHPLVWKKQKSKK